MDINQKTINGIRMLSVEQIERAKSGHPGLPLGAAPMAYTLWAKVMKHNPENPEWINRDRFILSAGHGSAMLYSLLHLFDYGLTIEDLKNFRQLNSKTPGHPEYGYTRGVEATSGPLGQGVAQAVGMAIGQAHLASKFNRPGFDIIDHYTYALVGDGCLMEGISYEAMSLAGTLALDRLIVLYDSNEITIDGRTDISFTEDVKARMESQNWQVLEVEDGNNIEDIEARLLEAKEEKSKPTIIIIKTKIGYGSPVEDNSKAHGAPLGQEGIDYLKKSLNWTEEAFNIPQDIYKHMEEVIGGLKKQEADWEKVYKEYKKEYPDLAKMLEDLKSNSLDYSYLDSEEYYSFDKDLSTRVASGEIINRLAKKFPNLMGGSADLAGSNMTWIKDGGVFSKEDREGRNINFGIREHAMGSISNGLALYGGIHPYCGTFLVFSDYLKPSMRLSALMGLGVTYVLTHDSIGVGEDGPTHQPIEHLSMMRSIPNFIDFRPGDSRETAAGWKLAMTIADRPIGLALSRQTLVNIEGTGDQARRGGYVLRKEEGDLDIILIASGSELRLAVEAAEELAKDNISARVVSMPSFKLFDEEDDLYKEEVLPSKIDKRIVIEASNDQAWYKYIGREGRLINMKSFGESAKGDQLFDYFGFTVENVVKEAKALLEK